MNDALIAGGFILLARKLLESGIMDKPHLFLKLWIYCLLNAVWKDHGNLKRGQLFTSIDRLRDALSYKIGYRIVKPSAKEIRAAYEFLAKGTMVVIAKVTRGMIITIVNYDIYQNYLNYEGHTEGHDANATVGTLKKKEREKERKIYMSEPDLSGFYFFYQMYPKHEGKKKAQDAWTKINPDENLQNIILQAVDCQIQHKANLKASNAFCPEWPLPATWLNGRRWEDELTGVQTSSW